MPIFKKIIISITLLLFLGMNDATAGDIPESFFAGNQKALFIGILQVENNNCFLLPRTIMMGDINKEAINTVCFDKYYGTSDKPMDGDIVVAVLNNDLTLNDWLFKATSTDYKKLKLVSERFPMAERYENYINEGKYFDAWNKKIKEYQGDKIIETSINESKDYPEIYFATAIASLLGLVFLIKKYKTS